MEYAYGNKLNPECHLRITRGIKGTRQKVIITHNPSDIDQNQLLMVKLLKLGSYDIVIPGTTNLFFNIELLSKEDLKKTLVSNIR